jgi:hypothetical protein
LDKAAHYDQDLNDLLARLRDGQCADYDIAAFAQRVAALTALDIVFVIDEGHDPEAPADMPTWSLEETGRDGELTGRSVGGLHESIGQFPPRPRPHKK